jgi:Uma2 family endonuclease
MATGALVSIEDYLRTTYKSARDYVDGVLYLKSLPARKHGLIQTRLGQLINVGFPTFEAASEVTFQIRTGKHLVPDLIAQERGLIQDPHPTAPVHLCVEILSPEDRMSPVIAKCEEYHAWGVENV